MKNKALKRIRDLERSSAIEERIRPLERNAFNLKISECEKEIKLLKSRLKSEIECRQLDTEEYANEIKRFESKFEAFQLSVKQTVEIICKEIKNIKDNKK